ncbi:uncharacterized protein METZ01_LOCUS240802, partial [marine metagenome]
RPDHLSIKEKTDIFSLGGKVEEGMGIDSSCHDVSGTQISFTRAQPWWFLKFHQF